MAKNFLPKFKRKVADFLKQEDGRLLKQSAVALGAFLAGSAILSAKDVLGGTSHSNHGSHSTHTSHSSGVASRGEGVSAIEHGNSFTYDAEPEGVYVNHNHHSNHGNHGTHSTHSTHTSHGTHSTHTSHGNDQLVTQDERSTPPPKEPVVHSTHSTHSTHSSHSSSAPGPGVHTSGVKNDQITWDSGDATSVYGDGPGSNSDYVGTQVTVTDPATGESTTGTLGVITGTDGSVAWGVDTNGDGDYNDPGDINAKNTYIGGGLESGEEGKPIMCAGSEPCNAHVNHVSHATHATHSSHSNSSGSSSSGSSGSGHGSHATHSTHSSGGSSSSGHSTHSSGY